MEFETEEALLIAMVDNDVRERGEGLLKRNIYTDVYRAYSPSEYERRWSLLNKVRSEITKTGGYSVEYAVTSLADAAPPAIGWRYQKGGFLYMLENGDMGFWRKGFPRPSISTTQSQFDRGYLSNSIRNGIKSVFG